MYMNEFPEGYPLKPIDKNGKKIVEGDQIKIEKMPESVLADYLSDEEVKDVMSCEGIELKITEIDQYGFVWVEKILKRTKSEYNTHSLSLEPHHVTKL